MAGNEQSTEVANTDEDAHPKDWSSPAKMTFTYGAEPSPHVTTRVSRILEQALRKNSSLAHGLTREISVIGSRDENFDEVASNFTLGFLDTMEPRDPAEALLLTQMAATHQAAMMMARRLNHVETIQQQESAERTLNKLMRTFTTQMEALKRYRAKGQQVVRVERVTVEEGGQAIVGSVQHDGGANDGP